MALSALPLSAADLLMPNGERLKGEVVERTAGTILFQSDSFGLVTVPAEGVVVTEGTPSAPAATSGSIPVPRGNPAPTDTPSSGWLRGWLNLPPRFEATLSLGLDLLRSEVDVDNYTAQLDTKWVGERNEFQTYHQYQYGNVEGTRTDDEYENAARWIRHLGDDWIFLSQANWLSDRVKSIDYEVNVVAVPAYYLIRSDRTTLLGGLGAGHRWERFDVAGEDVESHFNVIAYQLFRRKFTDRLSFEQTFLGYLNPGNSDDRSFVFEATLQQMLTRLLSINLKYSHEFDHTPAPGVDETKARTMLMMGYHF